MIIMAKIVPEVNLGFRCAKIEINEHMEPRKKEKRQYEKMIFIICSLFSFQN